MALPLTGGPMAAAFTPLCLLADKYQTDKGGVSTTYGGCPGDTCHTYTKAYYGLLADRALDVKRVLEIGINAGGSLRMWEEFFLYAQIVGLDIRPEVLFNTGRIRTYLADQSKAESLLEAIYNINVIPTFDLIVDDGSHELQHQLITMKTLLPFLEVDGLYVIEDVGGIHCTPRTISDHVPAGFAVSFMDCPDGIGKAHCPVCGGPEALVVIRRYWV